MSERQSKNHWLRQRELKLQRFWTSEFSRSGVFVLRPRRVEVTDPRLSLGFMGQTSGYVTLGFTGALSNNHDGELLGFFTEARGGMDGWLSRLRLYAGLSDELEHFELGMLRLVSIGIGAAVEDVAFEFHYDDIRHFHHA